MKKVVACLLAFCLLIQLSTGAFAAGDVWADGNQDLGRTDLSGGDNTVGDAPSEEVGLQENQIEVQINSNYAFAETTVFNVTLSSPQGVVQTKTAGVSRPATFGEGLAYDTDYTITVTADHYLAYTQQNIRMDRKKGSGLKYVVKLFTSYDDVKYYAASGREFGTHQPGVIPLGDVNGDGKIDRTDVQEMEAELFTENPAADLNGDGRVDLADLQYLSENVNRGCQQSDIFVEVLTSNIAVGKSENTTVTAVNRESGEPVDIKEALFQNNDAVVELLPGRAEEEISPDNPVEIGLTIAGDASEGVPMEGIVIKSPFDNTLESGEVIVEYLKENGEKAERHVAFGGSSAGGFAIVGTIGMPGISTIENDSAKVENGNIVVDLGGQIAVKKVTIRITGTASNHLAEISQVEFLNDMKDRIPEPTLNIPHDIKWEAGSKSFGLAWSNEVNVTGYDVEITHYERDSAVPSGEGSWIVSTDTNYLTVTAINGKELVNYDTYKVRIRSVNASWKSKYSEEIAVIPKPTDKPAPPDNVVAAAGSGMITLSWKKMKDTLSYTVYYQEKDNPSTLKSVPGLTGTSYEIRALPAEVKTYTVWVTGTNELGEGGASLKSNVTTTVISPVRFPEYMLFTKPSEGGISNIKAASWNPHDTRTKGMYNGKDTESGSAMGLVDNDFGSYYHIADWDDGCSYAGWDKGVTVTLTEKHEMNMIMFADIVDNTYYNAAVYYMQYSKDLLGRETATEVKAENVTVSSRLDENGRRYHIIKLYDSITTDQVRICLERSGGARSISIAEMRFYDFDPIENKVRDLFEDSMHLVLKKGVNLDTIEKLRREVNEAHPYKDLIHSELDTAEKILKDADALKNVDVVTIYPSITAKKDGHLGFGGLNSWQPLGITAYAGEELAIYVGHAGKNTGAATELQVVVTQYHAESTPFVQVISQKLKVGQNLVTVPEIASFDFEKGGSVYIQYTGNNANDVYGVRVAGGQPIPVLDLYGVEPGSADWLARTESYVAELETQVSQLEKLHNKAHKGNASKTIDYEYDKKNCILGATEIMMDQMMLSVSGEQILNGLGDGTTAQRAAKLAGSLQAMEEMMTLFYHHKGLSNAPDAGAKNKLPAQHLNIRYHRMFAGAFMYASGNHIGIEWDSVAGLSGGEPIVSENGKYVSGNYFGWGIAHEIGHDINQGTYAIAEVTNNFFSVLAQAKETNESVRFSYENVYDKVTSGATGRASNVFTQLGMYWQLHLAYDKGYNYKIYDTYKEQLDNLFFARVDTYARNVGAAPKTEIPLSLYNPGKDENGKDKNLDVDIDQKLMRLSAAAAQRDLTEFFVRWGMVPDEVTAQYMAQFEKEDRAIYYVNDEARLYAINHGGLEEAETVKGKDVVGDVTFSVNPSVSNQITISLSNTAACQDAVLGYEITRCITSGGKVEKKVVGFTTGDTFVDTVSSINNRVFTYEVAVIDKFLNRSASKSLEPVKVSHDGSYDKTDWTVTTNMISLADVDETGTSEDPCDPEPESAIALAFDNRTDTVYTGGASGEDPVITMALQQTMGVTALKYTAPADHRITAYTIQISLNGTDWTTVGTGTFQGKTDTEVVYFRNENQDPWVCTFDAAYVRLIAQGQGRNNISIGEIDLLGPTGDNVEFVTDDASSPAVGYLDADYVYDKDGGKIPKGSLVFVGRYKGNPAYNVVILYDGEGNIVGGTDEDGALCAHQIILADVPAQGDLGETSDGRFVYWIEPPASGGLPMAPNSVRAELYRVDNALSNEGQRLVSDTKLIYLSDGLPGITLTGTEE